MCSWPIVKKDCSSLVYAVEIHILTTCAFKIHARTFPSLPKYIYTTCRCMYVTYLRVAQQSATWTIPTIQYPALRSLKYQTKRNLWKFSLTGVRSIHLQAITNNFPTRSRAYLVKGILEHERTNKRRDRDKACGEQPGDDQRENC